MKKRTRIGLGVAVGIVIIAIIAGLAGAFGGGESAMQTVAVMRGTVVKTVDISGAIERATDVDLAFEVGGVVGGIPVVVGSQVQKGDILAFLTGDDLSANMSSAAASLDEAEANLTLALEGASAETRAQSAAGVVQAEIDLANAERALLDAQNSGNVATAQAESDVAQQTAASNSARQAAYVDMLNALDAAVAAVRDAVAAADSVLGVENSMGNDEFERYLGNIDTQALILARSAFTTAADSRDTAEDEVLAIGDDVVPAVAAVDDALVDATTLLLYVARTLSGTSIDVSGFSADDLAALLASISSDRATLAAAQTAFGSAVISYESDLRLADDNETDAAQALTSAEASRDQANAAASAKVASAEAALAARSADDAVVNAGPTESELAALRAAVSRARANYTAAMASYDKATLTAPFDGLVADIAFEVGEYVAPGGRMIRLQSTDDAYMLTLDVSESDIADLALGQTAHVTLDALGRQEFLGSVLSLAPAEKDIEGAVFYEAKVVLLEVDDDMRSGMSADVVIDIEQRVDALYLPQRTVLRRDGVEYVRIVADNELGYEERPVEVGLRGDDGFAEIINGVSEGDEVVVRISE